MTRIFLIISCLCIVFCKNQPQQPAEPEVVLPEGFLVFYEKFHRDSLFQLDHIQWPLQGEAFSPVLEAGKSNKEMRQWTRDSWVMHHPLDLGPSNLARTWMPVGSGMVVERVCEKISKLCLERRFAKNTSGEWELIYYIAY